jgi:hypothetical protein
MNINNKIINVIVEIVKAIGLVIVEKIELIGLDVAIEESSKFSLVL